MTNAGQKMTTYATRTASSLKQNAATITLLSDDLQPYTGCGVIYKRLVLSEQEEAPVAGRRKN
jgi:hypothetical protein